MEILEINVGGKEIYPIYIERNFHGIAEAFKKSGFCGAEKALIVTDKNVAGHVLPLYLPEVKTFFKNINSLVISPGEKSKSLSGLSTLFKSFAAHNLDRHSVIIALGGGVVGDLSGLAAATYMRGIRFVQVPTTLLSQVDSSVGGKTGINFAGQKNLIGAFHQPKFVYINVNSLRTLSHFEVKQGLAEMAKHGIIGGKSYFDFLDRNCQEILGMNEETLISAVCGSLRIKNCFVSNDERETKSGLREILNFGHTFGHAIESASRFRIGHGNAVSLGMVCALYYSREKGLPDSDYQGCMGLIKKYGLQTKYRGLSSSEEIYQRMFSDKKAKSDKLTIIRLVKTGMAASTEVNASEKELIIKSINALKI